MTFYNKYRPKKLSDVIGNTVLVDSLKKQIKENSLPHSFLFYGPSGSGKTTLARVLALSINCEIDNLNPCLSCSSCTQILNNTSPDFKEINTSDLRGIDAMRSLIDMFKYVNFSLKNRVIILDECHSLTNEAMNCLLKSLEEPPKNTYIILCTTDPLKLLETIRTRCAKHEFFGFDFDEKVKLIYRVMDGEGKYISDENVTEFAHYVKDSPREILNSIELLFNQEDPDTLEAIQAVTLSEGDTSEVIDLIRAIINNNENKFLASVNVFNSKNLNAEKIRMYVLSYTHKVLLSGKKDLVAHNAVKLMSAFTPAIEPSAAKYDVMCRFYSCLWGKL